MMMTMTEWRPWVRFASGGFARQKYVADPRRREDFQALTSDYLNNLERRSALLDNMAEWAVQLQMDEDEEPTGLYECQLCGDDAATRDEIEHQKECPMFEFKALPK